MKKLLITITTIFLLVNNTLIIEPVLAEDNTSNTEDSIVLDNNNFNDESLEEDIEKIDNTNEQNFEDISLNAHTSELELEKTNGEIDEPLNINSDQEKPYDKKDFSRETESLKNIKLNGTSEPTVVYSESCGTDVTCTIYSDYSMVITGDGVIEDIPNQDPYSNNLTLFDHQVKSLIIDVSYIGDNTFWSFFNISSVTFTSSVSHIGAAGFSSNSLTSITIPSSVTYINGSGFDCHNLSTITVDPSNPKYDSRDNCNAIIETATNTLILGCNNTVIPNTVTKIGELAFAGNEILSSITIPSSVTSIGNAAFVGCTGLTSIVIPSSVTSIDEMAFYGCSSLTSIAFPSSLPSIDSSVYDGCDSLQYVYMPEDFFNNFFNDPNRHDCPFPFVFTDASSTELFGSIYSSKIFYGVSFENFQTTVNFLENIDENSSDIVIPDGVVCIPSSTFKDFDDLLSIEIPSSVGYIGSYAFYGCSNLTSITIPDLVTSIHDGTFKNCTNLVSVTIPDSVTSIGESVFENCICLHSIFIPDSVTSIGQFAFSNCNNLISVFIPDSTTYISLTGVDICCDNITSIAIPSLSFAQELKDRYGSCTKLANLYIPSTLNNFDFNDFSGYHHDFTIITDASSIPQNWHGLDYFLDDDNYSWEIICGVDYDNLKYLDFTIDFWNNIDKTQKHIDIPNGVLYIPSRAFFECDTLQSISIPSSVISIGEDAFACCSSLQSISIPDSVTSIGKEAFACCSSLESVIIPDSISEIKEYTFACCSKLESITIPNSITNIGDCAFYGCSSLKTIALPNALTSLSCCLFSHSGLTSIIIPSSVTSIGYCSFCECFDLSSVTIPSSVSSIDEYAFCNCPCLTSISIPSSVTSIGKFAFGSYDDSAGIWSGEPLVPVDSDIVPILLLSCEQSSNFLSIVIDSSNPKYDSRDNCNAIIETATNTLIQGCKNTVIPNTVEKIGDSAFLKVKNMSIVSIPNSVTSIGAGAFYRCSGFTSLEIPDSVTSIGQCSFSYCDSLSSISISAESIGRAAFAACPNLTSINISSSFTAEIDSPVFGGEKISSITVDPANPKYDSRDNCNAIIETATNTLIQGCNNTVIPNTVTKIGNSACNGYKGLSKIIIPDSVTSIGSSAFSNCSNITSLQIPNTVTSIGGSAFSGCSGLTSLVIPDSVTSIGDGFISGCSGLTSLTMPMLTSINYYSFSGVSKLTSIHLTKETGVGVDYTSSTYTYTPWYKSKDNLKSIILDEGITKIGDYTFKDQTNISSLIIPSSVTSIGAYAFDGCNGLTLIKIPSLVSSIGEYAFKNCSKIASVSNLSSISAIEEGTFENCTSLTSIDVPSTVLSIGSHAFNNCSKLLNIYIPNSVTSVASSSFNKHCRDFTIYTNHYGKPSTWLFDGIQIVDDTSYDEYLDFIKIDCPIDISIIANLDGRICIKTKDTAFINELMNGYIEVYDSSLMSNLLCTINNTSFTRSSNSIYIDNHTVSDIDYNSGSVYFRCITADYKTTNIQVNLLEPIYIHYINPYDVTQNEDIRIVRGEGIATIPNPQSLEGYIFDGWFTSNGKDNGKWGTQVKSVSKTQNSDVTVYAKYTLFSATISFDKNKGTGTMPTFKIYYDGGNTLPANTLSRKGYLFDGWKEKLSGNEYVNEGDVDELISDASMHNKKYTFVAQWQPITYTIIFDGNDEDSGSMTNMTMTYDVACNLTANSFTKKGYKFNGWTTTINGKTINYKDKQSIKNITDINDVEITLCAKWQAIPYTIKYNLNKGTQEKGFTITSKYTYPHNVIELPNPTRTGYIFKGWYTTSTFDNGTLLSESNDRYYLEEETYQNFNLYAKWEPISYKIVLHDGFGNEDDNALNYEGSLVLDSSVFTSNADNDDIKGYKFDGWTAVINGKVVSYKDKQTVKQLTTKDNDSIDIYAKWTATTYTIKYNLNGGSNPKGVPTSYYYGIDGFSLPMPTKKGYIFEGWYTTKDFTDDVISSVSSEDCANLVLYAKWDKDTQTYQIKYFSSISGELISQGTYTVNDSFSLSNPTNVEGYTFKGWYLNHTDSSMGTKITKITKGTAGILELTAVYEPIKYNISFNANGGKGSMSQMKGIEYNGGSFTLPYNKFTNGIYSFAGWAKEKNGDVVFADGATINENQMSKVGTLTLYAKWIEDPVEYQITYNKNDDDTFVGDVVNSYYASTPTFKLPSLEKEGKAFIGWYDIYGNKITSINKGSHKFYDLYAHWKDDESYNVELNYYGGSLPNGKFNPDSYSYGKSYALISPIKEGYKFLGWYNLRNEKVTKITSSMAGDLSFYANYEPIKYNISFNANGGKGTMAQMKGIEYDGDAFALPANTFVRDGYTFIGWSTNKKDTIALYEDEEDNLSNLTNKASTITLYALWEANTYTIHFNPGSSSVANVNDMDDLSVDYGISSKLPINEFANPGFKFNGWTGIVNGKVINYKDGASIKNLSTQDGGCVYLTAKWIGTNYSIKYNLNGGSNPKGVPTIYVYGSEFNLPIPTRKGYTFEGWYDSYTKATKTTQESWGNKVTSISSSDAENLVLFAKWTKLD